MKLPVILTILVAEDRETYRPDHFMDAPQLSASALPLKCICHDLYWQGINLTYDGFCPLFMEEEK